MTIRRISVLQKEAYSDNKWIFLFWLYEEWKTQKLEFVVRQLYSAKITVNGTSLNVEKKQHKISHNWRGHFRIIHEGSIYQIWLHSFGDHQRSTEIGQTQEMNIFQISRFESLYKSFEDLVGWCSRCFRIVKKVADKMPGTKITRHYLHRQVSTQCTARRHKCWNLSKHLNTYYIY